MVVQRRVLGQDAERDGLAAAGHHQFVVLDRGGGACHERQCRQVDRIVGAEADYLVDGAASVSIRKRRPLAGPKRDIAGTGAGRDWPAPAFHCL